MLPSDQELVYVRVEGFPLIVAIAVVDLGDFGASLVVMSLFLTQGWSGSFCFVPRAVFLTHLHLQELGS